MRLARPRCGYALEAAATPSVTTPVPSALLTLVLCFLILALPASSRAQEAEAEVGGDFVNWYYSAAFGTGVYRAGDQTVTVFRLPFSRTLRPLEGEQWGIKLLLPLSVGYYDFDVRELTDIIDVDNIGTLSFLPGVELQVPVTDLWTLKPFAQIGGGGEFSGGARAFIYAAGIRSRYTVPQTGWEFRLGNALTFAGYDSTEDDRRAISTLLTSLDFESALGAAPWGRNTNVTVHLMHYFNFNEVDFAQPLQDPLEIDQEFEFALSLALERPLSLLGFNLDRLGLGFRFGEDITAVRLIGGLPY